MKYFTAHAIRLKKPILSVISSAILSVVFSRRIFTTFNNSYKKSGVIGFDNHQFRLEIISFIDVLYGVPPESGAKEYSFFISLFCFHRRTIHPASNTISCLIIPVNNPIRLKTVFLAVANNKAMLVSCGLAGGPLQILRELETGAGSTAQDTPNITFSGNQNVSSQP